MACGVSVLRCPLLGLIKCIFFSTGSCWNNCNQKNWCLPPIACKPRQTTANDSCDDSKCQGARPDWTNMLAVHEWRTRTQTKVMLFLCHLLISNFLCYNHFCIMKWISMPIFLQINLTGTTYTFINTSLWAIHTHLYLFLFQLNYWVLCNAKHMKPGMCKWIIVSKHSM